MSEGREVISISRENGKIVVKRNKSTRPALVTSDIHAARAKGRAMATQLKGQLVEYRADGTVRSKDHFEGP